LLHWLHCKTLLHKKMTNIGSSASSPRWQLYVCHIDEYIHHFDKHVHHFDQPRLVAIYDEPMRFLMLITYEGFMFSLAEWMIWLLLVCTHFPGLSFWGERSLSGTTTCLKLGDRHDRGLFITHLSTGYCFIFITLPFKEWFSVKSLT
jgi:hypothetical protein